MTDETSAASSSFHIGDRVILAIDKDSVISVATRPPLVCRVCGCEASSLCSRCKQVRYCSRDHQKNDWKAHKPVCQQNLNQKELWAGQHGIVAEEASSSDEHMLTVDLDLLPPELSSRVSVAAEHLRKEPEIPAETRRAAVAGGSLVPEEGRAINLVLDCMRLTVATLIWCDENFQSTRDIEDLRESPGGFMQLNKMTSTAWSLWKSGKGYHGTGGKGIYEHLYKFIKEDMPSQGFHSSDTTYQKASQALDDQAAVKGWNCRIHGDFWIVGMDDDGTFLVPETNRNMVYQCCGVRDAIWPMVESRPGLIQMTLTMVPWYGRLIYDGVLVPPGGRYSPPTASPTLERELRAAVEKAKTEGRVISRLAQLEVEGGSLSGLHDRVKKSESSPTAVEQGPPTEEERKLLTKLAEIPGLPARDGDEAMLDSRCERYPMAHWVFRRFGYTEAENPNHFGIILANANPLGPFRCSALVPTSVDILKAMVTTSTQMGIRPILVGVDDEQCCERIKRLLEQVDGTDVYYYPPPTPEETDAALAAGNYELGEWAPE